MSTKTAYQVYSDHIQAARDTGNEGFLEVLEREVEHSTLLTATEIAELLDDVYEALAYLDC